ncbi:MAG: DUF512 domain-containing protein, partial [Acidimicrobiales bacterium]
SIHSTDPDVRAEMLRNRRGATSLRWLRALLDEGIEVHGQVVVCPGINDGPRLEATLCGVLDEYPELASLCVVPLGVSAHSDEPRMRPHTTDEAAAVCDMVERWQEVFLNTLGHRLVFASDEYYLRADRSFPEPETYEGFPMHEDGIGMARTLELEFFGAADEATGVRPGFFAAVDGAPADGYRAPRTMSTNNTSPSSGMSELSEGFTAPTAVPVRLGKPAPRNGAPIGVLSGELGARVITPLIESLGRNDVRVIEVPNHFFGGNTAVTGLMTGADLNRVLRNEPAGHRYLLPDVCLSRGVFLDGVGIDELCRRVDVVATNGIALREALTP